MCLFVVVRALILDRRIDWFGGTPIGAAMLMATQVAGGWRNKLQAAGVFSDAPASPSRQSWRQRHDPAVTNDMPALPAAPAGWRNRTRAP